MKVLTRPLSWSAFSPRSRVQLKSAVDACLKLSPKGKCSTSPHGPIGTWDVSRVTDMSRMFARAKFFDSDVSRWDVSRVKNMRSMFLGATSFNGDVSKWDVSRVVDMRGMFLGATLFQHSLCSLSWVNAKANKDLMFEGSSRSMSEQASCKLTNMVPDFAPESKTELKSAVEQYLENSQKNEIAESPHGPIGEWDVSRVTDMSRLLFNAASFDGDISEGRVECDGQP